MRRPAKRRWLRLCLYWLPLLILAPLGGWLFVPSKTAAFASPGPGHPGPGTPNTTTSTTSASTTIPPQAPHPESTPPLNPKPSSSSTQNAPLETNPNAPKGVGGVSGQILFEQDCAACHGEDGQGTARSEQVSLHGIGAAAVDFQLTTGRMPRKSTIEKLPPYRAVLPEADIKALDYYISNYISKGGPAIPAVNVAQGNGAHGGEYFREYCAACHSWAGAGGVLYDRSIPRITDATPKQVGEAIRTGPDQMPVFGPHELTQQQINDIAAYVTKDLEHPYDKGGDAMNHIGPIAEGFVILAIALPLIILFSRWIGQRG